MSHLNGKLFKVICYITYVACWLLLYYFAMAMLNYAFAQATVDTAEAKSLPFRPIQAISASAQRADIEQLLGTCCPQNSAPIQAKIPRAKGRVSLQSMFSSQSGSWPFEPFVNNGLFEVIASYQPHHPQAVVLSNGTLTLPELAKVLGDERILRPHKDGYLLSYPLMIEANAALLIKDTSLYLYTESGAALINQGTLHLDHATLTSWKGDTEGKASKAPKGYRPFVMAWAGSTTLIESAHLEKLGYNANLARGITVGRSSFQSTGTTPARIRVQDSSFREMSTALDVRDAIAQLENNLFAQSQQYALDFQSTQAEVRHNQVSGVRNNSGIRVQGKSSFLAEDNHIQLTGKAGIESVSQDGSLVLLRNQISQTQGNGIQLRATTSKPVLIAHNQISESQSSGIDAENVAQAYLVDNQISLSQDYAISYRNPGLADSKLVLVDNKLNYNGKAMLRTENIANLVMGSNLFQVTPVNQAVLTGDLQPMQSPLLDATVTQGCFVKVLGNQLTDQNPNQLQFNGCATGG